MYMHWERVCASAIDRLSVRLASQVRLEVTKLLAYGYVTAAGFLVLSMPVPICKGCVCLSKRKSSRANILCGLLFDKANRPLSRLESRSGL